MFDLDPAPDVDFNEVIKGALAVRKRLEKLGLETFCKTTGGKGLHVVTPLTSDPKSPDWDAAKMFAKEVCRRLAVAEPERYLLNMAKKERNGPHLPRLPAQRPHLDGRRAAVAARPRRAPRCRCRWTGAR